MKRINLPTLGIDIGRVIIHGDGPDTSFVSGSEQQALATPALAFSFETIERLCTLFERRIWLVSKCGPRVQARTRRWLDRQHFFQRTGVPYGQLRFCIDRKDKAPICAQLGIQLFVDDRLDVLAAMQGIVPHRFQFGVSEAPPGIVATVDWQATEAAVRSAYALLSQAGETPAALAP